MTFACKSPGRNPSRSPASTAGRARTRRLACPCFSIDAAAANYTEALAIDPEFEPALFNLAIIRADQGSTDEAIELYRRLLATDPEEAGAHLNLGFLLLDRGQRKEGRAELATAVALDPSLESRIPDGLVVVVGATGP